MTGLHLEYCIYLPFIISARQQETSYGAERGDQQVGRYRSCSVPGDGDMAPLTPEQENKEKSNFTNDPMEVNG